MVQQGADGLNVAQRTLDVQRGTATSLQSKNTQPLSRFKETTQHFGFSAAQVALEGFSRMPYFGTIDGSTATEQFSNHLRAVIRTCDIQWDVPIMLLERE